MYSKDNPVTKHSLGKLTDGIFAEAVNDLATLIRINSQQGDDVSENAPFGSGPRMALDFMLAKGAAAGMFTGDVRGYAGFAELQAPVRDAETLGVMTHLDVVPQGYGWTKDQGSISKGTIWGRGAIDNKGPTLACFHALRLIQRSSAQFDLKRNIRLIWGCNEESGNACMDYYAKHVGMPEIGFSPDGSFPIITCEKTILQMRAELKYEFKGLLGWSAGTAPNAVPSLSVLRFHRSIAHRVMFCLREHPNWGTTKQDDEGNLVVTSTGKSAHAMEPKLGENAAFKSAWILLEVYGSVCNPSFRHFVNSFCTDSALARLNLECVDSGSGEQTMNVGKISYMGGKLTAFIDFRCPVTQKLDKLKETVNNTLSDWQVSVAYHAPYKFIDKNSELIRGLARVYTRMTGKPVKYIITGGGTYARKMENCVAFGPTFEDDNHNMHDADEFITLEQYDDLIKIYYAAMLELAT